jgi:hypothetical protein
VTDLTGANPLTINFSKVDDIRQHKSGKQRDRLPTGERPMTADGKVLTPKQIRARARRRANRAEIMTREEADYLYQKPIEEWDTEELARGRPRNSKGSFSGPKPKWISAAVHEQAMERFTAVVKEEMNATTVDALKLLTNLMNNDEVDDKGKPIVPAGTKLDAAKFLIEHVIGKPKQRIESDVSVKLQGILGTVMANPAEVLMSQDAGGQGYTLGHLPGVTMPMGTHDQDVIDAEFEEFGG